MAFTIPLIVKLKMPNPAPLSGNCDVVTIWSGRQSNSSNIEQKATNNTSIPEANMTENSMPISFDNQQNNNNEMIINTNNEVKEVPNANDNLMNNNIVLNDQTAALANSIPEQIMNTNPKIEEPLITTESNGPNIDSLNIDDIISAPDIEDMDDE